MITLYLAAPIEGDSIVNGEGLRTVIWFQGCPHHCPGCHNPESHPFKKGIKSDTAKVIEEISKLKNQDGITFSGGEPMSQPEALFFFMPTFGCGRSVETEIGGILQARPESADKAPARTGSSDSAVASQK